MFVLAVGCKSPGNVAVTLDVPDTCAAANHVQVYFIKGGRCDDCACGDCLQNCTQDNCTLACTDGLCPIERLDSGLAFTPPSAGNYAVVYQLLDVGNDGRIEEVASACADNVQLDKDGTSDADITAPGTCCPAN